MSQKTLFRWLFALLALAPGGACNAGSKCLRSSDCASDYMCRAGACELRNPPIIDASFDVHLETSDDGHAGAGGSSPRDSGLDARDDTGGAGGEAGALDIPDAASSLDSGNLSDAGDASAPDAF